MNPDPRCRSGKYCSARTSDGAAITAKPDTICSVCVQDIERKLEELPHLAQALRSFLGGSMKVAYESKVNATREPAAPMNVMVADLIDLIGDVIDRTDGLNIRTLIQRPAELYVIWTRDVRGERYLTGVDRALDIRRVHHRVSSVVGLDRVWQKRHAPCPNCDLPTLGSWVGEEKIHCTNEECQLVMTLDDYEKHCIEQSRESHPRQR